MRRVSIIGAGLMGHGLAVVFAMGGHEVVLHDISASVLEKAARLIGAVLDTLVEAGVIEGDQRATVEGHIARTTDLPEAASAADLIVEAVTEDPAIKRDIFSRLDGLAAMDAILLSNTSYLNVFDLIPDRRQSRSLIAHWYTPPYIIDLVDIVPGPRTDDRILKETTTTIERLGKKPLVLKKFISGYVANRLQAALNSEVFYLLDNGYATPEQIDAAVKTGLALRMPLLGFFKKADYTGLDMVQHALKNSTYRPPEASNHCRILDEHVRQGRTGVMAGRGFYDYGKRSPESLFRERDRKLLALRKFLAELGDLN